MVVGCATTPSTSRYLQWSGPASTRVDCITPVQDIRRILRDPAPIDERTLEFVALVCSAHRFAKGSIPQRLILTTQCRAPERKVCAFSSVAELSRRVPRCKEGPISISSGKCLMQIDGTQEYKTFNARSSGKSRKLMHRVRRSEQRRGCHIEYCKQMNYHSNANKTYQSEYRGSRSRVG